MWEREKEGEMRGKHQALADSGFKGWTEEPGLTKKTWKRRAQSRTTRRQVSLELGKRSSGEGPLSFGSYMAYKGLCAKDLVLL